MASSTAETVESQRIWLWQQFAIRVTPSVQRVVEFAKRLPGFSELPQDDQLILIKVGFFEVWLSHISKMTNNNIMIFEDGTYITKQQLELIYEVRCQILPLVKNIPKWYLKWSGFGKSV